MTHSTITIESLTELANDLMAQNAGLKNKIDMLEAKLSKGISVYAEKVPEGSNGIWSGYEAHTMFPVEQSNAILLLDEEER